MKISDRVMGLATSPIRKLTPYANAAAKAGKKIHHLNIGQPDIPTADKYFEGIRSFADRIVSYGPSQGSPDLIAAIRKYYAALGMDYEDSNIYITNGGSEALLFASLALCDPGEEIIVFEPYYANYNSFGQLADAKMVGIPTSAEEGYRLPSEEVIESYITPRTRAILVTNPGNPTGVVFTKEEMDTLARVVLRNNLALIADEVYREFVYDGSFISFGTYKELADNLVMVDSISKRYSCCGGRIGCLITKNKELCAQFNKLCQSRLCCPEVEQAGAAALYETPASYLENVNREYKKRRDTIYEGLSKLPGVIFSHPQGAFYLMVKFPVDDAEKFAIWMLENFDVDGETVMIAPGNGFYSSPDKGVDEARLAYVINSDDLKKACRILGEALKAYPGSKR